MRALIATLGSLGDAYPLLALADRLQARGHHVVVAAPERYRDLVRADGLQHRLLRPDMRPERYRSSGALEPGRGFEVDLEFFLRNVGDTFDDLASAADGADVLIAAPLILPALLIAATNRLFWVEVVYSPSPSLASTLPPELQYLAAELSSKRGGAGLAKRGAAALSAFCRTRGIALSALRARPDLGLYLFPDWFVGPRVDWPQRGRVAVGFCFRAGGSEELPPALAAFLSDGERPIVLTLGSTAVHVVGKEFYDAAATAVRKLGRKAVFLADPRSVALPAAGSAPADIIAVPYAPARLLFQHASVVVHHGGIGTISEALRAGVPQLAIPFGFDQPSNAVLASRLGVAGLLAPRDYGAEALERAIGCLLNDPAIAESARAFARRMGGSDGAEAACALIETRLGSQMRTS